MLGIIVGTIVVVIIIFAFIDLKKQWKDKSNY
jgi:hypothetical protein